VVGSPRRSGYFRSITSVDTARFVCPSCILPLDKTYLQRLHWPAGCRAIMQASHRRLMSPMQPMAAGPKGVLRESRLGQSPGPAAVVAPYAPLRGCCAKPTRWAAQPLISGSASNRTVNLEVGVSETTNDAFGGQWDLGEAVVEHLISYPISHMIHESAREAGIDLSNPTRSIVSLIASGFMGSVMGSFLGPFGAILGGLMGETLGLAGSYPGDRTREERLLQQKARFTLRVKAMTTALEITRDHVGTDTWNSIVDEYQRRLRGLGDRMGTDEEILNTGIDIITNSVYSVDRNVYSNFDKVYRATRRELGV
jgi:hypothetical protein